MKRKMFMSFVMIIIMALGLLGQAVAAKDFAFSQIGNGANTSILQPPSGVLGGAPGMCSYSSSNYKDVTFRCALDVQYYPYGFFAIGSRSFDLKILDENCIELRREVDRHTRLYKVYRSGLDGFLDEINRTYVTWDELIEYGKQNGRIGLYSRTVISDWKLVQYSLQYINTLIDPMINP
ncbi:hypothetical protein [Cohnella panacarvi]|uniref:hypothetical protein n=1 Tax=Cohnella panacarvi TaxID=400776 RepID=UPI00047CDE86|nr:hypothetical protein [Cohnella panacarvi]